MEINHVCMIVRDVDESLKLYCNVLGFEKVLDIIIPEGKFVSQKLIDDSFKTRGARSRMVIVLSPEGSMLEFQQPLTPHIQQTPDRYLRYGHTGISKIVFKVEDVDAWFEKISQTGLELQTEYVWQSAEAMRSFIFYDVDGHMVQICQIISDPRKWGG